MSNFNIKIPLQILQYTHLSPLSIIIYGELLGLQEKYGNCHISDETLAKRLNKSVSSIQRGMHMLKNERLITSKQNKNHKGRTIKVKKLKDENFLLIPEKVERNNDLTDLAKLVYGELCAQYKVWKKIADDSYKEGEVEDVADEKGTMTKAELANRMHLSTRTIRRRIAELEKKKLIEIRQNLGFGFFYDVFYY